MKFGVLAFGVVAALLVGTAAEAHDLVIVHARIYADPKSPAINDRDVVVRDGRIVEVGAHGRVRLPATKETIDATGCTLIAGLWNSHVHILTHELLQSATLPARRLSAIMEQMFNRWGFTTVFDLASSLPATNALRRRIESGEVVGPQILTVGDPFYPKGGTPVYVRQFLKNEHIGSEEISTIPQALARVDRQVRDGADGVKLFTGAIVGGDVGVLIMPGDAAAAIAAEAHKLGKPVFAHPSNQPGVERAIESHVDILAHTAPMAGMWDSAVIARMRHANMALIPTLSLFEIEARKFGESAADLKNDLAVAEQQTRAYSKAGGDILFGTDIGYTDVFDTSEELRLMSEAGLGWREILASLTVAPAKRFGYARQTGEVRKGMSADLVLVHGDPSSDVMALAHVYRTIRRGAVVYSGA